MSETAGPSGKDKGKSRAMPTEDVETHRVSISAESVSSSSETSLIIATDYHHSHIRLDHFPTLPFGGIHDRVIRRWDWIEHHCVRGQDLMRKQRRILYDAVSALVKDSEVMPIHDWISGMNSVLRSAQRQPEKQRWWVRVFQVIGTGRSQHRSLETQRKDIEHCQKTLREILSKWNEDPPPIGWHSRKMDVLIALEALEETLAGQQRTSDGLVSSVRENDPTQGQDSNNENGGTNEGGVEGRGGEDGEEEDDGDNEKQDGVIEEDQGDATEEQDSNDEGVADEDDDRSEVIPKNPPNPKVADSGWDGKHILQYLRQELEDEGGQEAGYVVLALRSRTSNDPLEKIVKISTDRHLFKELRKGINILRGWRGLLSLKSLKAFGLFKCDIEQGHHFRVELSPAEKTALSQFFDAYKAAMYRPDSDVAKACSEWIFTNLNGQSLDAKGKLTYDAPLDSSIRLSLELIYDWSAFRLSVAVVFPLLLSLAIGIWYMKRYDDVVTAWTISIYVVGSAAAVVTLLGIIGSLKNSQVDEPDARLWRDDSFETFHRPTRSPRRIASDRLLRIQGRNEPAAPATAKREDIIETPENPGGGINAIWYNGHTPLSRAAVIGNVDLAKRLLEAGAYINYESENGQTPLACAAENKHPALVKLLLESEGVRINAQDSRGRTPLSLAAENGPLETVKLLLDHKDIDVNLADDTNRTPLLWAMKNFKKEVVDLLLERHSVDVTHRDITRRTPLLFAAQYGWDSVVKVLLERQGVDVNSEDENGRTSLSLATENGSIRVMRLLLEHKDIDTNLEDITGRTPLFWARSDEAVLNLLLKHEGISVDFKNKLGQTPLSLAAENGNEDKVQILLEQGGADVNSQDKNGRTPLSWAAECGHVAVMRVLLRHKNIDINLADKNGRAPEWWAERSRSRQVRKLLVDFEEQAKTAGAAA